MLKFSDERWKSRNLPGFGLRVFVSSWRDRNAHDRLEAVMIGQQAIERRTFMVSAGAGIAAVLAAGRADAADWTDAEKANVKVVTEFCAVWTTRDVTRALPFLAQDCVYRMTETTAPANGHEGVIDRLKPTVDRSTKVEFRVLDTFAAGPIVINHRIDQFVSDRPLTWEGVGVFFVKDGKIKEWSDYTIRVVR
jgi:limonene-1,2-epoxide hydrolase